VPRRSTFDFRPGPLGEQALTSKYLTVPERVSGQKFRRAHAPSAFQLQFQDLQRALAATDHNPILIRRQNLARRSGFLDGFRFPNF